MEGGDDEEQGSGIAAIPLPFVAAMDDVPLQNDAAAAMARTAAKHGSGV